MKKKSLFLVLCVFLSTGIIQSVRYVDSPTIFLDATRGNITLLWANASNQDGRIDALELLGGGYDDTDLWLNASNQDTRIDALEALPPGSYNDTPLWLNASVQENKFQEKQFLSGVISYQNFTSANLSHNARYEFLENYAANYLVSYSDVNGYSAIWHRPQNTSRELWLYMGHSTLNGFTFGADLAVDRQLIPYQNNGYYLGSASNKWKSVISYSANITTDIILENAQANITWSDNLGIRRNSTGWCFPC